MILYLDASALVKRYIQEKDSEQVNARIHAAEMVVTSLITRVEVAVAIVRARRMNLISPEEALAALRQFRSEWESFQRLPITENTVIRGGALAYEHNLRGYDATHLACALIWQETLGMPISMASFDGQLIEATRQVKMASLPIEEK
ncbi:MAG: type II toxin-antitoxin system VapC family toxin [Chloroflexota bacterium]